MSPMVRQKIIDHSKKEPEFELEIMIIQPLYDPNPEIGHLTIE